MIRAQTVPPTPLFALWLVFFAYAALVAVAVQFVVLPYWLPQLNAGQGLMIGGDWLTHHALAVDLAQQIKAQGWSAWQLRPHGQAPAGIAAAIYALSGVSQPWTLIPLNAALHALAALLLLRVVQLLIPNWRLAILAVLPFLLYPSAALWYTQILKDGYSIAGALAFLYGWLLLARMGPWKRDWKMGARAVAFVVLGGFLAWIVRPYMVQIFQGISTLLILLLVVVWWGRAKRRESTYVQALSKSLLAVALVFLLNPFTVGGLETELGPAADVKTLKETQLKWERSGWLPSAIEGKLFNIADIRRGFILSYPEIKSGVDTGVYFHSVYDIVSYIPRALQIVLLAPFPTQWLAQSSLPSTQLMRHVAGFEMVGIYAFLLTLLYALWRLRRRVETWMILIFGTSAMLILGLSVPNVGTLYRMRYGYVMALVALGVAGVIIGWQGHQTHHKNKRRMASPSPIGRGLG